MEINDEFNLTQEEDAGYLQDEVYDIIRTIKDPEFPNTLEELNVVDEDLVKIDILEQLKVVNVTIVWVPTTPTCGLALNIALSLRAKLELEFSMKQWAKYNIYV